MALEDLEECKSGLSIMLLINSSSILWDQLILKGVGNSVWMVFNILQSVKKKNSFLEEIMFFIKKVNISLEFIGDLIISLIKWDTISSSSFGVMVVSLSSLKDAIGVKMLFMFVVYENK